jgi:hypothetical protein
MKIWIKYIVDCLVAKRLKMETFCHVVETKWYLPVLGTALTVTEPP